MPTTQVGGHFIATFYTIRTRVCFKLCATTDPARAVVAGGIRLRTVSFDVRPQLRGSASFGTRMRPARPVSERSALAPAEFIGCSRENQHPGETIPIAINKRGRSP